MSAPKARTISPAAPVAPSSQLIQKKRVRFDTRRHHKAKQPEIVDSFALQYISNRYGRFAELDEFKAFTTK